jgi:outer membrane lipoprotein-sorting protein
MKARSVIQQFMVCLLFIIPLYANSPTAPEILARCIKHLYAGSSIAIWEVKIIRPAGYDKFYQMKIFSKGRKKMLAQFLAPAREVGRALLCNGDIMRLYLPDISKSIRVSPEQLFMGSDFSHGDLMQIDLEQDYQVHLLGTEKLETDSCYVLELTAQNPKVAYNKIQFWIRQPDFLPVRQEYYTLSGKLLKILTYSQPQNMGGVIRPTVLTMINVLTPEEKTVVTWLEMRTDVKLSDYLFTQQYLEKQ